MTKLELINLTILTLLLAKWMFKPLIKYFASLYKNRVRKVWFNYMTGYTHKGIQVWSCKKVIFSITLKRVFNQAEEKCYKCNNKNKFK